MIAATYIINLPASDDRWRHMQPILEQMRAPAPRKFGAVDGAQLKRADIHDLQRRGELARDLSKFAPQCLPGELGCALSHRGVLVDIVARQLPAALILEDDIALNGASRSWPRRFARALADLPKNWDIWYLYRCFDLAHRVTRLSRRVVIPWSPQGGAAYAVTLAGAEKLLRAMTPIETAVDRVYADLVHRRAVCAFAASPQLVVAGRHPSIINRDSPGKEWVTGGINQPPEYWPKKYLHHLGETAPRGLFYWWQDIVNFAEGVCSRLRRMAGRT